MKFFIIAGEASGDLHAAHLMRAIKQQCPGAEFRYYGGEQMQAEGGTLLCHYRQLAYMGFVQVALHLRTILRGMARCKREIEAWQPDALILVDYPGFNLKWHAMSNSAPFVLCSTTYHPKYGLGRNTASMPYAAMSTACSRYSPSRSTF